MTYEQRRDAFKTDVRKWVIDLKVRHQLVNPQIADILRELAIDFTATNDFDQRADVTLTMPIILLNDLERFLISHGGSMKTVKRQKL